MFSFFIIGYFLFQKLIKYSSLFKLNTPLMQIPIHTIIILSENIR